MKLDPFKKEDIAPFLRLASAENWVTEPWEFEFLLASFPQGCFAARNDDGEAIGFVTSIRHEQSGWIGNLIVHPEWRGKGTGAVLFKKVNKVLSDNGVDTVWLTASSSGLPLYRKLGFTGIDSIIRWRGAGQQLSDCREANKELRKCTPAMKKLDRQAWGDRRDALLEAATAQGRVQWHKSGFVVVQQYGALRLIGPFSALDAGTAATLLDGTLSSIPRGTTVCLDAPAANRTAHLLFTRSGMNITGSSELMYAGVKPAYLPEHIYGLATMGSCG